MSDPKITDQDTKNEPVENAQESAPIDPSHALSTQVLSSRPMPPRNRLEGIRRQVIGGSILVGVMFFGVGVWAATTLLSGAIIAPGLVVVESSVKRVQHQTGGIVGEIRVKDGSAVKAGDIVIRLDETVTRATLSMVSKQLTELQARQARLEAERDGADSITFPEDLIDRQYEGEIQRAMKGEVTLFTARNDALEGQRSQLSERILQLKEEIRGLQSQVASKKQQNDLIKDEMKGVELLYKQNLVPYARLTALQREASRLKGEEGSLVSDIARAKGRITETELQMIQLGQNMRREVIGDLREAQGKIGELVERRVAALDQLKRTEIRSPQTGLVHQLAVHTVGGVITPGEAIMQIVPQADSLVVEARIAPQDIDQVRVNQPVILRLSAFHHSTTPEITGKVINVSADITREAQTNMAYYTLRISIPEEEIKTLGEGKPLVPGMPVEAFMKTADRTALSYLVKPFEDQIARAFREE